MPTPDGPAPVDAEPLLALQGVTVTYGERPAVLGVDLALAAGQVLAVLGPSGCGKSTLLRAVAGLEPLTAGRVLAAGADQARVPTHRRGFALMFQDGQLFAHLSVAANVAYPLRLRRTPRAEARRRVADLLDLVGLATYADRLPSTLSGGERQRVALARALAVQPRLLLLDEPLSALDAGLRERLAVELRDIVREAGTTALLVTHDHEEAFTVADRLAVMRHARVVQEGPIAEVWAHPVDPDTALFLGYARVVEGPAADRVLDAVTTAAPHGAVAHRLPGEPVALRRSALVVSADGALPGRVLSARATPDLIRLEVDVEAIGTLDAVASGPTGPAVGDDVRLGVDVTRLAPVRPGSPRGAA